MLSMSCSDDTMTKKPGTTRKEHPMKEPDDRSRRCFLKASSMLGLAAAFRPATMGEVFAESRIAGKKDTMTRTSATQAADTTIIRPFQVNVPEAELTEL